jgi:hypothetical protein
MASRYGGRQVRGCWRWTEERERSHALEGSSHMMEKATGEAMGLGNGRDANEASCDVIFG